MKLTRRLLVGSLGLTVASAVGLAAFVGIRRSNAPVDQLLTEPEDGGFVYRDGWIVRS